jgi:hypothetical protein
MVWCETMLRTPLRRYPFSVSVLHAPTELAGIQEQRVSALFAVFVPVPSDSRSGACPGIPRQLNTPQVPTGYSETTWDFTLSRLPHQELSHPDLKTNKM